MNILKSEDQFNIRISRSLPGLNFITEGNIFKAVATFVGRNNKECVVAVPMDDLMSGTNYWIHSDYYHRILQ